MIGVVGPEPALGEIRMDLDLVDGRHHVGLHRQPVEMVA